MAEYIEFKAPEIGVNRVKQVKPSNKVIRNVWNMQLSQAKMDDLPLPTTNEEAISQIQTTLKMLDETEDFVATTLGLSKKQKDAMEDLSQEELGDLSGRLQAALLGIPDDAVDTDEEDEPNPKSGSAKE